jgi:hypothetical protein
MIPPEKDEEEWFTEKGVSRGPTTTVKMLEQEEKKDAQWMECKAQDFSRQTEVQCRRAENRGRSEAWSLRPRGQGNRRLAGARSIMVGVIAMLTASLASLAGVEGFKA